MSEIVSCWKPDRRVSCPVVSLGQVAVRCLETASWGAYHNVSINLKDMEDAEFRERTLREAAELADQATVRSRRLLDQLQQRRQ